MRFFLMPPAALRGLSEGPPGRLLQRAAIEKLTQQACSFEFNAFSQLKNQCMLEAEKQCDANVDLH